MRMSQLLLLFSDARCADQLKWVRADGSNGGMGPPPPARGPNSTGFRPDCSVRSLSRLTDLERDEALAVLPRHQHQHRAAAGGLGVGDAARCWGWRSEEHTSELQ